VQGIVRFTNENAAHQGCSAPLTELSRREISVERTLVTSLALALINTESVPHGSVFNLFELDHLCATMSPGWGVQHIFLFGLLTVLAAGQSDTVTASASVTTDDLICYASPTGACLTASYILSSCLSYNNAIDDLLGCECSNGYDTAWSK
jgi:hypothetical protein